MRNVTRWDPLRDMMSLRQAMDRLFEDSFIHPSRLWKGRFGEPDIPLDIYETDSDVVVRASLPGIKPEDVDVTVCGHTLTIKGESKVKEEVKEENYIRQERRYGAFSRSVELPPNLQIDKAEATFEQGMLTLKVPKSEEAKPKSIKINIEGAKK